MSRLSSFHVRVGDLSPEKEPEEILTSSTPKPKSRIMTPRRRLEAEILERYPDADVDWILRVVAAHTGATIPASFIRRPAAPAEETP